MTNGFAVVGLALVLAVTIALGVRGLRIARTPADFMVASREVRPRLNAAAISGEYLSAASFLGVAGLALVEGLGALWYAVGYLAGYLILLTTVAAPLRRFGAYTIPDFAEGRLESVRLRKVSTAVVLLISTYYLLPQLKGAGVTLQAVTGTPYWVGVVVLGGVVTATIASGGMKGITVVQAFHFWLKLLAISVPIVVALVLARHVDLRPLSSRDAVRFDQATTVRFPSAEQLRLPTAATITVDGSVDGQVRHAIASYAAGSHDVAAGTSLTFAAGSLIPSVAGDPSLEPASWSSPFVHVGSDDTHPLLATYGVIVATFLGTIGLPHILVRFYTNRDGKSARRTTALVVLLLASFYVFPAVYAAIARATAPGLYLSGQSDATVLVLPRILVPGTRGALLAALASSGAMAAFLSTSSGLLISAAGALSHDLLRSGVRSFRLCATAVGVVATLAGLAVRPFAINVLVGWAFAIAASTFCPLLVLGIWWRRLTRLGALAGLITGAAASSAAILAAMLGIGHRGLLGVLLAEPGAWTVPLSFAVMIVVSLRTQHALPHDVTAKLLALHLPEGVHVPSGPPYRGSSNAARRHVPTARRRLVPAEPQPPDVP